MLFKKIDATSKDSVTSALNLFNLPTTNVSASKSQYREYLPLNPVSDPPYQFKVYGGASFLDLSKCYLFTELHIEKLADNKWVPLAVADKPNVINGIGATFVSGLKIGLGGRETYNSNRLQAYRAYMDMCLSYPKSALDSHLQSSGFYNEDKHDSVDDGGYKKRLALVAGGKRAQFISRIYNEIFLQERLLINQLEMTLEITPRLADNFCIQAPAGDTNSYRLVIDACKLYVKEINLIDGLSLSFASVLSKSVARYPIRKTEMKSMVVGGGRREFTCVLHHEITPRRLVLGLVDHPTFMGSTLNSPFNFQHANIQSITVFANGLEYPSVPYYLDFKNDKFIRAYHDQQEAMGFAFSNFSNTISREKFKNGWCLFVINMTSTLEDEECFDLVKTGTTTLRIQFAETVQDSGLELIVGAEFDSVLLIDNNRVVSTDNSA